MKSEYSIRKVSPTRSLLQKVYGNPKPVREYKRFPRSKLADTGEDPKGATLEFIKRDIIRPLERSHDNHIGKIDLENKKWAVGTTKNCFSIDKLPKVQQYRDYNFHTKIEKEKEGEYKSYFHKTDHISIRVPKIKKKEENESFLNLKSKFGPHTETYKDGWVPQGNFKTMNNRSSVNYNILSCDNNTLSGAVVLKIMDKKLANKKKGITEFVDRSQPYNPNINKKYRDNYDSNNNMFHVYNGIFSHMYDAAHRNGNMAVPFRNSNPNEIQQNIKENNSANFTRTISPQNKIRNKSTY